MRTIDISISKVLWKITKHDEKIKPYIHIRTLNFELQPFSIGYIFLKRVENKGKRGH